MRAGFINFAIERQRHDRFVECAARLAQLDQLLSADPADRWIVVTGGPGMDKRLLLAAWLSQREVAGDTVPHYSIRRGWDDWDQPKKLVDSLVAQIEARAPDQRDPEPDPRMSSSARLDVTFEHASERELMPHGERLVVLIDGLDEYDPPAGSVAHDPLAAFLRYALPRGVSFLCASQPRHPYVDMLATRGTVQFDLDDEQSFATDNEATARAFWEQAAPEFGLDARFIASAMKIARGNLQHAATLHLAGLPPAQRRLEDNPRGLAALLASAWDQIATDPLVVDGLGVLRAAREVLSLDEIGAMADWTGEAQRRAFVRSARELLIETQRAGIVLEYRLHHNSIHAHGAGAISTAALHGHHRAIAQNLVTWPAPLEATNPALERNLVGHADSVRACTVTPNGRRVVSASADGTLKVWDLASHAHRANCRIAVLSQRRRRPSSPTMSPAPFGLLTGPRQSALAVSRNSNGHDNPRSSSPNTEPPSQKPPMKHTILFLAANLLGTDRLALDEECAGIERELRMTSGRDDFDFHSKWAVGVDELMRHLNELQPAILHFSGAGSTGGAGAAPDHGDPHRDIESPRGAGIFLQDGRSSQYVSERALAKMIASAAPTTRVVVLNACFSATVAESLRHEVGCVVGMDGAIGDAAARSFAVAFYRALGNRRSVGNAVAQAVATLAAKQLPDDLPVCRTRDGLNADQIFLPTANPNRPDPAEPQASRPEAGTAAAAQSSRAARIRLPRRRWTSAS